MERATTLLLEICGGEAGEILWKQAVKLIFLKSIQSNCRSKLDAPLGHHIETGSVTEIFHRLVSMLLYANDIWTVILQAGVLILKRRRFN